MLMVALVTLISYIDGQFWGLRVSRDELVLQLLVILEPLQALKLQKGYLSTTDQPLAVGSTSRYVVSAIISHCCLSSQSKLRRAKQLTSRLNRNQTWNYNLFLIPLFWKGLQPPATQQESIDFWSGK